MPASEILIIECDGPDIVSSNFWESKIAAHGKFYISIHAGCIRLLVPNSQKHLIDDIAAGAQFLVLSVLDSKKWTPGNFCIEWMVEDNSETPFNLRLSSGQIDSLPNPGDAGKTWAASVWIQEHGAPRKCLEFPAFTQIVPKIPWLKRIN